MISYKYENDVIENYTVITDKWATWFKVSRSPTYTVYYNSKFCEKIQ